MRLRYIVLPLMGLLLLLAAAPVMLPLLVDTRQAKTRLETALSQALGQPVAIHGELGLHFLPRLELRLNGLELGAGPDGPWASCREARVSMSLTRLAAGGILLRRLTLDGLALRLERQADGGLGWRPPKRATDSGFQNGLAFEGVQAVTVTDGSLVIEDAATGMRMNLERLQARYRHGQGFLSLTTALRLDLPGRPGGQAASQAGGQSASQAVSQAPSRLDMSLSVVGGFRLAGGSTVLEGLDLHADLRFLPPHGQIRTGTLQVRLGLDAAAETLRVENLDLSLGELRLHGSLQGRSMLSAPALSGSLETVVEDVAWLTAALDLPTPVVALGRKVPAHAVLALDADGEGLELRGERLTLGETMLAGRATLTNWREPAWRVELEAQRLNLDELRLAAWPENEQGQGQEQGQGLSLLLDHLRQLKLDLGLRAQELVAYGVHSRDMHLGLHAEGGLIQGRVERVDLEQGRYSSKLRMEVGQQDFSLTLDGRLVAAAPAHAPLATDGPLVLRKTLRFKGTPQGYAGSLEIPRCDLRELFRVLGIAPHAGMAPEALRQAALSVTFGGTANGLRMPSLDLTLDGMSLRGSALLVVRGQSKVVFDLRSERLDLAPYLSASAFKGQPAQLAQPALDSLGLDRLVPLPPGCPAISGSIVADRAALPGLSLGMFRLDMDLSATALRLNAQSGSVLGGRASAKAGLSRDGQGPRVSLTAQAQGLDADKALALVGRTELLGGRLNGKLNAEAQANNLDDLLRNVRLSVEGQVTDGRLAVARGQDRRFSSLAARLIVAGDGQGGRTDGVSINEAGIADKTRRPAYGYGCALEVNAESPDPALALGLGLSGGLRVAPDGKSVSMAGAGFRLSAKGPTLRDERQSLVLRGKLSLDSARGSLDLADLTLSGPGLSGPSGPSGLSSLSGRGQLGVEGLGGQVSCTGSLELDRFNPRQALGLVGMDLWATRDPEAMSSARAKASFSLRQGRLNIPHLELELDDFHLAGNAHILDMSRPRLLFDLAGTGLDYDRYRPLPRAKPGPPGPPGPPESDKAVGLPLKTLGRLAFKGRLRLERLVIYRLLFEDAEAMVEAADGVFVAKPIKAKFFEGPAQGEFKAVARPEEFAFETQAVAQGASMGRFLDVMAGGEYVRGPTDVHLVLRARGATKQELAQTLSGSGSLEVAGGSVSFSPREALAEAAPGLSPSLGQGERKMWEMPEEVQRSGRTRFTRGTANVTIENGVVRNNDLLVRSPAMRGTGSGYVDLVRKVVDYAIVFEVINTARVPLHFEGDFDRLDVGVRTLDVIGTTATGIVRKPFDILFGILPGIEWLLPAPKPR